MRTLMLWLIAGIWLMHASCTASGQAKSQPESKSPNRPSRLLTIDIERLDPSNHADYPKIIALLRSQDIPVAQRIEYARRYIRGDSNPTFAEHSDKQLYAWVITCAVLTLARLNDIDSIPLIEEKLEDWQATRQRGSISPAGVYTPVPRLDAVRVSLARLKAVRDVPEVKTSDDLIRRLRRMLHHLGFNGTIDEWLQALSKELNRKENSADLGTGLHEWTLRAYMGFLLEAGWQGVDIDAAAKVIQLDWQKYPVSQVSLKLSFSWRECLLQSWDGGLSRILSAGKCLRKERVLRRKCWRISACPSYRLFRKNSSGRFATETKSRELVWGSPR